MMNPDLDFYLSIFQQAADRLDKRLLHQKQLQVETGVWLDSVILKLHKRHWAIIQMQNLKLASQYSFRY